MNEDLEDYYYHYRYYVTGYYYGYSVHGLNSTVQARRRNAFPHRRESMYTRRRRDRRRMRNPENEDEQPMQGT